MMMVTMTMTRMMMMVMMMMMMMMTMMMIMMMMMMMMIIIIIIVMTILSIAGHGIAPGCHAEFAVKCVNKPRTLTAHGNGMHMPRPAVQHAASP